MLKKFQGEWPVDVIVQDYYSNLVSTAKDKASGAYRRRRNGQNRNEDEERSDEGGGAGGDDEEDEEDEDEDGGGGGGDDDDNDNEAGGDGGAVEENPYAGWRRQSGGPSHTGSDDGNPLPGERLLTFVSIAYHFTESPPAAKRRRLNNGNADRSKTTGKLIILCLI